MTGRDRPPGGLTPPDWATWAVDIVIGGLAVDVARAGLKYALPRRRAKALGQWQREHVIAVAEQSCARVFGKAERSPVAVQRHDDGGWTIRLEGGPRGPETVRLAQRGERLVAAEVSAGAAVDNGGT